MAEFPELSHIARSANGDQENSVSSVCIPTEQQIRDLLAVHDQLNAIYAPLAAQYISLREDITRIARDIAYEPQSDQELEILKAVGLVDSQASSAAASTPGVVRRLSETTKPLVNGSVSTKSGISISSAPTPDFLEPPVNHETLKVELKVLNALRPRLTELVSIWEYVGYNEEERADHLSQATQKLRCTLEDIIAQENAARLDMEQLIERKRREVAELCQQLRIPSYLPDRTLSSNDLLKVLKQKSEELFELKSARCTEYTRLRGTNLKRMAEFPELSHIARSANGDQENSVSSDWRFKLVKEKARLVGMCEELRAYLTTMWLRLDKPVAEQAQFLDKYSGYKPDTLEALQEEVDRCQQLKWEKLDTYLDRLNAEATKLARLCCMDEKIVELPTNQDSTDPEVVANHLETVLEHLNQTYSLYKPIFESIGVYEELWQALSEVELRLKDPAIFSNRGGILLKTEKEKKRLTKELQRAEQDTLAVIEQYELKTKSVFKLSNGQTFKDYIADRSSGTKQHARDLSRARRSVVSTNSRPASTHTSAPPGAPT
ncbi:hypothetical protein AHF37_06637 [Paragonimus kellicotti]|nr:hypothetical protein AHF37_06637 [Paragonimus kellicotti]